MIDEKMAKRCWPHQSAVGKRLRDDPQSEWATIVGVAATVNQYGFDRDLRMVQYYLHSQVSFHRTYVVA